MAVRGQIYSLAALSSRKDFPVDLPRTSVGVVGKKKSCTARNQTPVVCR